MHWESGESFWHHGLLGFKPCGQVSCELFLFLSTHGCETHNGQLFHRLVKIQNTW